MRSSSKARGDDEETRGPRSLVSQTAQYALRAIAHIAVHAQDQPVRAADMAHEVRVPLAYLQKVMRRLVAAGLLVSQKGHGGGFTLSRAPERIRFSEVLKAVDGLPEPNRCAFGWGQCDKAHPCPLHPAWSKLDSALRSWAETTTLADLAPKPIELRRKR